MKTKFFLFLAIAIFFFNLSAARAQQPLGASDFTLTDCDGTDHHLFDVCDSGHVVMMEFVMGCLPCVQGGKAMRTLESEFNGPYPGKIHLYTMSFSAGSPCSSIQSWMMSNNFSGTCFAGNGDVITNYGANSGMPTIAIVGGPEHKLLYWKIGFSNKDTAAIKTAIAQVLTQASVASSLEESLSVFPNPSTSTALLKIVCKNDETHEISVYDANGVKALAIQHGLLSKGEHSLNFSTKTLASGSYFIHVTATGKTSVLPLAIVH
jgi:hypothetical protein